METQQQQNAAEQNDLLLDVRDLRVEFPTLRGVVHALQGVSFHLSRRETLGLAGETGCGKSVTALATLRLVSAPGRISGGRILFEERDLLQRSEAEMRAIRGNDKPNARRNAPRKLSKEPMKQ